MSLAHRVDQLLAPGGRLASRWPGWERRESQAAFARDVAWTMDRGGILLAEAPTGVGKSLAYLLPAVLHASRTGARVIVATCTRSLQDQLFERDVPALLDALDLPLAVAVLKGKSNYLCPRALEIADAQGAEETQVIEALREWAASDATGDLDRFDGADAEAFRRVRPRVAADPAACGGATCRRGRECFWARARRNASEAALLVVNHALLARAAEADGLLPEAEVLVVDEAHRLEGVLVSQLELGVSRHRFDELVRLTGSLQAGRRSGGGLLARLRGLLLPLLAPGEARETLYADLERLAKRGEEARAAASDLFARVAPPMERAGRYGVRQRYRSSAELLGRDLAPVQTLLEHCAVFANTLRRAAAAALSANAGNPGEELAAELEMVAGRWAELGLELDRLADASEPDWVYWRSVSGRATGATEPAGAELRGAPVSVAETAWRLLLSRPRAVVLASATLSAGGDFAWAAERLGLGESSGRAYDGVSYPSPFPLHEQMRAYVLDTGAEEADAVADVVAALAEAEGRAAARPRNVLVLFTAHERLRRVRERLVSRLPAGRRLLAQDWDGPAGLLVERFRAERGAVLLGVQSLWEGVDFPGEALEVLVVAKLPFSVPDDPIVEARGERLRERGVDPFRGDAVPEAVLRFRQGVGRLIRRADDRGVLVVCDSRLATAGYRRSFLDALPVEAERMRSPEALAADAVGFLEQRSARVVEEDV